MTDTIHRRWAEYNHGEAADEAMYNNELREQVKKLTSENEQLRSRLNCYNLGGWTDSLVLIKERDDLRVSVKKANDQAEEFERKWYLRGDELDDLRVSNEKLTAGLKDAAQSLETISTLAGRKTYGTPPLETYMDDFMQVRGYANSRAIVAREVIKGEPTC